MESMWKIVILREEDGSVIQREIPDHRVIDSLEIYVHHMLRLVPHINEHPCQGRRQLGIDNKTHIY